MLNKLKRHWILLALGMIIVAGVFLILNWDWFGEKNDQESNGAIFRNTALFLLSLLAAVLAWKRIEIAHRQVEMSEENINLTQESIRLNYETLVHNKEKDRSSLLNDRYSRASQLLTSSDVAARLNAIHELQHVAAEDLEQFHVRAMSALCSFVRFPTEDVRIDPRHTDNPIHYTMRHDVQAAMEVIGSRRQEHKLLEIEEDYTLDLRNTYFINIQLKMADLAGANLTNSVWYGANLALVDFSDAQLEYAKFSSPSFVSQQGLEDAARSGSMTKMIEAIEKATLLIHAIFTGARLYKAEFLGVQMQGSNLTDASLIEANFSHALLCGAVFDNADMAKLILDGADLSGANMSGQQDDSTELRPPLNLKQFQLDSALADPTNPPTLCQESGLLWRGSSRP